MTRDYHADAQAHTPPLLNCDNPSAHVLVHPWSICARRIHMIIYINIWMAACTYAYALHMLIEWKNGAWLRFNLKSKYFPLKCTLLFLILINDALHIPIYIYVCTTHSFLDVLMFTNFSSLLLLHLLLFLAGFFFRRSPKALPCLRLRILLSQTFK